MVYSPKLFSAGPSAEGKMVSDLTMLKAKVDQMGRVSGNEAVHVAAKLLGDLKNQISDTLENISPSESGPSMNKP